MLGVKYILRKSHSVILSHLTWTVSYCILLKGLVNLKNIFETLHDLNANQNVENRVKRYASFKIMQISI